MTFWSKKQYIIVSYNRAVTTLIVQGCSTPLTGTSLAYYQALDFSIFSLKCVLSQKHFLEKNIIISLRIDEAAHLWRQGLIIFDEET